MDTELTLNLDRDGDIYLSLWNRQGEIVSLILHSDGTTDTMRYDDNDKQVITKGENVYSVLKAWADSELA